jgi:hypothetical protein
MPDVARWCALGAVTFIAAGCGSSGPKVETVTVATTSESGATTTTTTTASPSEKPDAFLKRLLDYDFKGQWGRSWALLHPGQRHYVDQEKFAECNGAAFPSAELVSVKTVEVYDDALDLPGVPQESSKAVTLKISIRSGDQQQTFSQTFHAVPVGNRWAWVLSKSDAAAYKSGVCPS